MTPLEISILLHYHTTPSDYSDGDFSAPAVRSAINEFKDRGYLKESSAHNALSTYQATDKLHAYVKAICNVPEPKQIWICE